MITCRKLIKFLDDYVAGQLPPRMVSKFEKHLAVCPCCVKFLKSYRQTIDSAHDALAVDEHDCSQIPDELVSAILASVNDKKSASAS